MFIGTEDELLSLASRLGAMPARCLLPPSLPHSLPPSVAGLDIVDWYEELPERRATEARGRSTHKVRSLHRGRSRAPLRDRARETQDANVQTDEKEDELHDGADKVLLQARANCVQLLGRLVDFGEAYFVADQLYAESNHKGYLDFLVKAFEFEVNAAGIEWVNAVVESEMPHTLDLVGHEDQQL